MLFQIFFHPRQLKQFKPSTNPNIGDIAFKDRYESHIDSILDHTYQRSRKGQQKILLRSLKCLVRWSDGSPDYWMPYSELKSTEQFIAYVNSKEDLRREIKPPV